MAPAPTAAQPPAVSVVVATHSRRAMLARLLDDLARQEGAPSFEVIVVDDASTDDTVSWLATEGAALPLRLRTIPVHPNRGPAHARNLGWRSAQADVVCFTDDDCEPTPGWLAAVTAPIASVDIVQGRTLPNPAQRDRTGPFSRSITVEFEEGFYETCNIAYRRSVLEELDGFQETFRFPFGEDTDLAWRARQQGATTAFAPDALVYHEVWPSEVRAAFRNARRLDGIVQMTARHPGLRRHAKWGVFARHVHPSALLALAGASTVLVAPREPLTWAIAAAAGLEYAWACRRHRLKPPKKWHWAGVVPVAFALDLWEIAVMARASARWRTLLL